MCTDLQSWTLCCTFIFFNSSTYISTKSRGRSRTTATSKMERFVIIVNGFQPLTIITKHSILDVAAVLDPLLKSIIEQLQSAWKSFFSVIIANAQNKDQGLIQIKWWEKVQCNESAQRCKLASLILCSINDNLSNTSSTPPPTNNAYI